jgi:GntR family transcriptional regulator/MocR family aminotransferase
MPGCILDMTVTDFNKSINLEKMAKEARSKGLSIADGRLHQYTGHNANAIRLGLASASPEEIVRSVAILKGLVRL